MEVQNTEQLSNYPSDYNHKTKAEKGSLQVKKNLTQQNADADNENNNGAVITELAADEGKGNQELQDDEMWYVKSPNAAKTQGYSYHVKLAMWFLLCGKEKIKKEEIKSFFLATDIEEAPRFGHIVFKYQKEGCVSKAIFLQAKHKENVNKRIDYIKYSTASKDFNLVNAQNAYSKITKCFSSEKVENRIFGEKLSDVECSFVFFTNASPNIGCINIEKMAVDPEDILYFTTGNNFYYSLTPCEETQQIILNGNGSPNIQEFNEFLSKLKLHHEQPNQEELGNIIKQKIQAMFSVEEKFVDIVFASGQNKIQEWLGTRGKSHFLTSENRFFEDAARVSITFDVKEPVGLFTGRHRELETLHKILQNAGEAVISQTACITGIGGVGKTELARKYISEHRKEYDDNVVWINAENYTTTTQSFIRVAEDNLGINTFDKNGKRKETQVVVQEIYDYFARMHRKSLFVFDNSGRHKALGDTDEGIDKFLPSGPDKPYVLITSRDQEWRNIKTLALDLFTGEEAAEFIRKALNDIVVVEESEVNKLAAELQYLPLALTQAVAYIKMENLELSGSDENRFPVSGYLELFKSNTRDLLCSRGSNELLDRYSGTVMTTWQITIAKIKQSKKRGEVALDILNIMSYLASDKIPVDEIFSTLINDENLRHGAVELLDKYCMVSLRGGKVNVHRLVQQVTRIELEEQGKNEEIVQKTYTVLEQSFPYREKKLKDIARKKLLIPHSEVFLTHIQGLKEKSTHTTKGENKIYLHLITLIVDAYNDLGNPQRQKDLLEAALPSFQNYYGPTHFQFATALLNLGNADGALGDPNKQKNLLEQALKIFQDHCKPHHVEVAITLVSLGNAHGALGDHHKKKKLLDKALKIFQDYYKKNYFQVAITLENLGNAHGDLSDHNKKKQLLERALKIFEDHYGPNHCQVATTLESLGNAHGALGDHHKKKELLERALKIKEDHYGQNHYQVAITLESLGNAHGALGDHHKKKKLLDRALKIEEDHYSASYISLSKASLNHGYTNSALGEARTKILLLKQVLKTIEDHYGPNHCYVGVTLERLGNAHGALGDNKKKKELLERALKIFEDHNGQDHFEVARTLVSLGKAHGDLGNHQKNKELLERALKIFEHHYGQNHYQVARTLVSLGKAHGDLGNHKKNKELLERALIIFEDQFGLNHYKVAITLESLGKVHSDLGNHQKNKELLKRALKIFEDNYRKNQVQVAITLANLGNAHGALGDPNQKKQLFEQALKIFEDHYGPNHYQVAITLESLDNAHGALGDHHKKKELLERALKIKEDHYGPNHVSIAVAFVNLGNAVGALGDHHKNKELLERALKIFEDHYGPNHCQVARTLVSLGNAHGALGDHHKKKELLKRALKIKADHYGVNHFSVAKTLANLSNAHGALGDHHKKKELLEQALKIFEHHYGAEHFQVASVLLNLGNVHGNLGDPYIQKELLERALKIFENHYGQDHFEVARTLESLGNAHGALGDHEKNKELLERALQIFEDHYGQNHYHVAIMLESLGKAHGDLGDHHKKKELLQRALTIKEDHYGQNHYQVAITLESLGNAHGAIGDHRKKKGGIGTSVKNIQRLLRT